MIPGATQLARMPLRPGQGLYPGFGNAGQGIPDGEGIVRIGDDADEAAVSLRAEYREKFLDYVDVSHQLGFDDPAPFLFAGVGHARLGDVGAGRIDNAAYAPCRLQHGIAQPNDGRAVGHIHAAYPHARSGGKTRRDLLGGALAGAIAYEYFVLRGGEASIWPWPNAGCGPTSIERVPTGVNLRVVLV